jgi:cell division protein FtsW
MAARAARKRPVEYSILYTATLCLLAFGAVMVYSASSAESLLSGPGDPSFYLKRYLMCGGGGGGGGGEAPWAKAQPPPPDPARDF